MDRLRILQIISTGSRKKWASGGEESIDVEHIRQALIQSLRDEYSLDEDVNWSNYQKQVTETEILTVIQTFDESFDDSLHTLQEDGCISVEVDKVRNLLPISDIVEKILIRPYAPDSSGERAKRFSQADAERIISTFFNGSTRTVLAFMENLGYISVTDGWVDSELATGPLKDMILDEVLTFIEKRDAHQIRYGIYETEMRGSDLFSELELPNDPLAIKLEFGLRTLMETGFLLPLKRDPDIRNWEFRSRIAEIVRLLSKLRQRFWGQTYRDSKTLTRAVKLEVTDRQTPRREIPLEQTIYEMLTDLRSTTLWEEPGEAERLTDRFISALKASKYRDIRAFQHRSFTKIFQHLISQDSRPKGMILTAGTGMGKTLSYIVPLLYYILFQNPGRQGTKSINIYPRIKLAENQMQSFIKILYQINRLIPERKISIAIDYSGTPYERSDFKQRPPERKRTLFSKGVNRLWEYDRQLDAYKCPYAECPACAQEGTRSPLILRLTADFSQYVPLTCPTCGASIDFVRYCKDDFAAHPPDIFITTTESLTARLSSAKYQNLFGTETFCAPKLIMVDEVHLYTSLNGTQVAYVIRRLLNRIIYGQTQSGDQSGRPMVLGLSATIGKPQDFFSELTGIPAHHILHEEPHKSEMEKSGVEHFIFIKPESGEDTDVLSNLLQTCMCVLHNLSQPTQSLQQRYKALGFVDSLDLVSRWSAKLTDAEKKQLFRLRDPHLITAPDEPEVRTYFGGEPDLQCQNCAREVNRNCIFYQQGECWWFMRYGNPGRRGDWIQPLTIASKTSQSGDVPPAFDLLVTTSAMEVGYDDPDIMCVIQYLSPMNIASFTQRKGRAGRDIRNRPVTVGVLSPYRTKDIFYYRNHYNLIEPSFEKPPLNEDNITIRRIHGFYGALDYLAYQHRNENTDFPYSVRPADADRLNVPEAEVRKYLNHLLGFDADPTRITEIIKLLSQYQAAVAASNSRYGIQPQRLLPNYLPENLFSSINLPSVHICDYNVYATEGPDKGNSWRNQWTDSCHLYPWPKYYNGFTKVYLSSKCPIQNCRQCEVKVLERSVDINLGLSVAALGNVSRRWGPRNAAYWIPPFQDGAGGEEHAGFKQMPIANNWITLPENTDSHISKISDVRVIPGSWRSLVPNVNEDTPLKIVRPDLIRVAQFITPKEQHSHYIYSYDDARLYAYLSRYLQDRPNADTKYDNLTDKTRSYPITFYNVDFQPGLINADAKRGRIEKSDLESPFEVGQNFGIFKDIFSKIYFANKDTGTYIAAQKGILGSNVSFATKSGKDETIFGYTDNAGDVALGYSMETEGIDLWFPSHLLSGRRLVQELIGGTDTPFYAHLKRNLFKFEVFTAFKGPDLRNSFAIGAFLEIYLYKYDHKESLNELEAYIASGCTDKALQEAFQTTLEDVFSYNPRTQEGVLDLFKDLPFMQKVLDTHKAILNQENEDLFCERIEDILLHSMKHALKSAFVVLGGFDSERDLCGWTYLNYDYKFPKHIYIFEHGMYGTGAFRSVFRRFQERPDQIWNFLESYLGSCPTAEEENLLRDILRLDPKTLCDLSSRMSKILQAESYHQRQHEISGLTTWFRDTFGFELEEESIRSLSRLFSSPLELKDTSIDNWRLYYELNIVLADTLKQSYGREPTGEEMKQACYILARQGERKSGLAAWHDFYTVLSEQMNSEYAEFERSIKRHLEEIPELGRFLDAVSSDELEEFLEISEEEKLERIKEVLHYPENALTDEQRAAVKSIVTILFPTEEDEDQDDGEEAAVMGAKPGLNLDQPTFAYYYACQRKESLPSDVQSALLKRAFCEEVEKRLLNTCIDGCPSCLYTLCDIDGDPRRNTLLLSRGLVQRFVRYAREKSTIQIGIEDEIDSVKDQLVKKLTKDFLAFVTYPPERTDDVSQLIHHLMQERFEINGVSYGIMLNSSGYREVSLHERKVIYELGFRCRRMSP